MRISRRAFLILTTTAICRMQMGLRRKQIVPESCTGTEARAQPGNPESLVAATVRLVGGSFRLADKIRQWGWDQGPIDARSDGTDLLVRFFTPLSPDEIRRLAEDIGMETEAEWGALDASNWFRIDVERNEDAVDG